MNDIKKSGGKGVAVQADVRDTNAVNDMAASVIDQFGKIEVLVNNADINFSIPPQAEGT